MDAEIQSLPRQFYEELKRRRVIRVATVYTIALWPIIQIVDILAPAIGLPNIALRYMLIVFVSGLPVVLILSWLYDLNKGGIVRTTSTEARTGQALIGRSAEIVIVAVLLIAIGVLFFLQDSATLEEEAAVAASVATTQPAVPQGRAIAVLPFVSFSIRREDELFTDGLTEELLNMLSQIKGLRVIARTTSFAYKGVSKNVQDIGAELNVDTILEGSVRRNDVDNTIRVTAQLIDTESGTHIWSNSFDREFRDIFKIQDEIAAAVVEQMQLTLAGDEAERIRARDTADPDAMVAYAMGRAALARRTRESLADAERYLLEATAVDPEYAAAFAELASTYALQTNYLPPDTTMLEKEVYLARAQVAVDKALALDARDGAGWAAQGLIYMHRPEQQDEARAALKKAIELNPNLPMANMWYGNLQEDKAEQQRYHARAFELDPLSPVAGFNLANDLLNAGLEGEAMNVFTKIMAADPNYPGAYDLIAQINEARGRLGEAIRNYEKFYAMQPNPRTASKIASLWSDVGDFERADDWIAIAERDIPPIFATELQWLKIGSYVARGDRPAADAMLAPLLEREATTVSDYLNRTRAGYFMGQYDTTIAAFEKAETMAASDAELSQIGAPDAAIAAAYAYKKLGRADAAAPLLERLEAKIQQELEESSRVDPFAWFTAAQVSAIKGETSRALIHLQRAVDEGWRQHWLPYVEPSLEDLVKEPAFEAMMQGLITRMDLMREQIAFDESFDKDWGAGG